MKKLFILPLALMLVLTSCEKRPDASFFVNNVEPEVGQVVQFTSESDGAEFYDWDFGDGYGSDERNPAHVFTSTGVFEVILTVTGRNGEEDQAVITIDVKIPTLLEIEVVEWELEYGVADASVRLYPSLDDWEDETNLEIEGFTDADGFAVFSHLGPYVWYVDVWETDHDNYTLKAENVEYIRTPEVRKNKINRFLAWVDYVDHGKGSTRGERTMIIRKLERKPEPAAPLTSTTGWEELYAKSIKVK